jgi:hypothetical protein
MAGKWGYLMIVKVLTLTQPWASLVMLGEKRIETRPVMYKHRGPLFIHASRQLDYVARRNLAFRRAFERHDIDEDYELPLGKVLGSVDVVDGCHFSDGAFPLCLPPNWHNVCGLDESYFGNFAPGRGGLLLANPARFVEPVPARGMNGLWNWELPA